MTFRKRPQSIRPRPAVPPEAQAVSDATASRSAPQGQLDETLWPAAGPSVTGARRASGTPHPGTAATATGGMNTDAGPSGTEGESESFPEGIDPQPECSTEPGQTTPGKIYRVDPGSVLEDLMGGPYQGTYTFETYAEARDDLMEVLEGGIKHLRFLVEELRRAEGYDDLDLGDEALLQEHDADDSEDEETKD